MGRILTYAASVFWRRRFLPRPQDMRNWSRQTQAEIESDWLVQAEKQKDFAAACRDEAARLKRVLSRLKKSGKDCSEFEKSLADIEKTADGREKYLALRVVKRDAMFSSLSFDKILVVDSPFPEGPQSLPRIACEDGEYRNLRGAASNCRFVVPRLQSKRFNFGRRQGDCARKPEFFGRRNSIVDAREVFDKLQSLQN